MKRIVIPPLFFNFIWNLHPLSTKNGKAVEELSAFANRVSQKTTFEKTEVSRHCAKVNLFNYHWIACILKHKRIEEHRVRRDNPSNSPPPFRSVLDELIDEGVDDAQIVDEVNTMMFGVIKIKNLQSVYLHSPVLAMHLNCFPAWPYLKKKKVFIVRQL